MSAWDEGFIGVEAVEIGVVARGGAKGVEVVAVSGSVDGEWFVAMVARC